MFVLIVHQWLARALKYNNKFGMILPHETYCWNVIIQCIPWFGLCFVLCCFVPIFFYPIYYLHLSIFSLTVVTQIPGHMAGSSTPPTHYGSWLAFLSRADLSSFFPRLVMYQYIFCTISFSQFLLFKINNVFSYLISDIQFNNWMVQHQT